MVNSKKLISVFILIILQLSVVLSGDKAAWKSRAVYQVLTDRFSRGNGDNTGCASLSNYCGGTFKGIEQSLDYIKGMGFDAIWISPVVEQFSNGYHGYWASNWEKINSNFGTADDLKSLVNTAHSKGIWVMVDVVANHVGPVGSDFSQIYPFNQQDHYHPTCQIVNWNDQNQVENCRLADLPDIDQSNTYVRNYLKNWVKNLVTTYGFDGIRIDTIPEVPKDFWGEYAQSAGVFQMGECFNGDPAYVGPYQQYVTGLFNYPMFYTIRDVFQSGKSMTNIRDRYNQIQGYFSDIDSLGIFVDNHDNPRFLNGNGDQQKFKSALVFALSSRGIPFFYYGSEQAFNGGQDPANREIFWNNMNTQSSIYQMVKAILAVRKAHQTYNFPQVERYADDTFYSFSRGDMLVTLTNQNNNLERDITYHPYNDGQTVCNIFYPTDCITVTNKTLKVYLNQGEQKIFIPKGSKFFLPGDFKFLTK